VKSLEKLRFFLPLLERPGRYLDHELNSYHKGWEENSLRVLLLFPDTYEVGMSHLGLRIIYHILNGMEGVLADRAYLPWVDALDTMEKRGVPLWGLETGRPVAEFHLLEVSLQHELLYTNLLQALRFSRLPLRAAQRGEKDPIVVVGGPATVNPIPIAPFVDLVFVGESEEAQVEMAQVMLDALGDGASREERITRLAWVQGMWSPALGGKVKRRIVLDLEEAPFPRRMLMSWTPIVHDRVTVEIMRGCSRGCRFCQAGYQYRPVRERSEATVLKLVKEGLEATGCDEVSLLSLSPTDHSGIHRIIQTFMEVGEGSFVSLSLPALRSGTLTQDLITSIRKVRKTGFTMAPEAGTQRLRDVINKNITEGEIMETVEKVFSAGWDLMKLYFMMGLPTETWEDLEGIAQLIKRVMARARGVSSRRPRLHVSVSPFIPKPHTPFQWEPQDTLEAFRKKSALLRRLIPRRGVELSIHNSRQSLVEALLARGGEETQVLLEAVCRKGALYDQWGERFDFSLWRDAIEEVGIDLDTLLYRLRQRDEPLPWDFVDMGFTKGFLWQERERALKGLTTPDCREVCTGCGLCDGEVAHVSPKGEGKITLPLFSKEVTHKLRIWLAFKGDGALLGHNHFVQCFIRLLRRAQIPLAYRGKFNPQARVVFAMALPLGMESDGEPCDLFLTDLVPSGEIAKRINPDLPPGINVIREEALPLDAPSLSKVVKAIHYRLQVPQEVLTVPFPKGLALALGKLPGINGLEVDQERRIISFVTLPGERGFLKPYILVKEYLPVIEGRERAVRVVRRIELEEV